MSSIPPDSPERGCSANFPLPVVEEDVAEVRRLADVVERVNRPLAGEIVYRADYGEFDIRHPVYRWNRTSYEEVFQNGFRARAQEDTPNETYYDLDGYVHNGEAPLNPNRRIRRGFVSTTLNDAWRPNVRGLAVGEQTRIYQYEIFAPGGIWVAVTLQRYRYRNQAEIAFVAGIAPQYIRSVRIYTATQEPGSRYPTLTGETRLIINRCFRPHLDDNFIICIPEVCYDGTETYLPEEIYPPEEEVEERREKREVSRVYGNPDQLEWYRHGVVDVPVYINAAFRSSRGNEAYIFMNNEYALVNYAPGTTNDRVVNGPLLICDGFPSLAGTPFGDYGIDCAFNTDYNQAYIFSGNLCAFIDYAPGTTDDKILDGPRSISDMFPCLRGTVFVKGIDAAFRATSWGEAYLFTGGQYVLLNYASKTVVHFETIRNGFPSLVGTVFENGIGAAFASHRTDEAYLFKGEYYALINFAPGTTDDYLVGGKVKLILPNWPSLRSILPRKNRRSVGANTHKGNSDQDDDGHDEL